MRGTCVAICLAATLSAGAVAISLADAAPPTQPESILPSEPEAQDLLGAPFENQSAGISLRLPAGCRRIPSSGAGDDIGQFGDEKRQWQLKLTRMLTPKPTSLTGSTDGFGQPLPGLLEITTARLQRDLPGCKILRQDLTNIRDGDPKVKDNVGMIAVRYTASAAHFLAQQAIVQASDRLFYLLALTSPVGPEAAGEDPGERVAVETFRQMLDSVRLLDTRKIREDQDERLVRTRALFANWKNAARLHAALINEQWLRVMRNGKDVGYSYITEQSAAGVPRPLKRNELNAGKSDRDLVQPGDGILIGIRARSLVPPAGGAANAQTKPVQIDSASWLFVTADLRLEDWSRVTVVADGSADKDGKPVQQLSEEFGSSDRQVVRSLDKEALPGTKLDPKQPPISIREQYTLNVTEIEGSGGTEPITRDLPPWYLPQPLGHLLPRLLPLDLSAAVQGAGNPKTYLFATYVPEAREVMHRYVDVFPEQQVTFAGKTVRAVRITDRLGYHGSITTHYMSRDGTYLGSENKDSNLLILPTDAATLLSIWKNANLTQPGGTERPRGVGAAQRNTAPAAQSPASR